MRIFKEKYFMPSSKSIDYHIKVSRGIHGQWFDYSCTDIVLDKKANTSLDKRLFICPLHGPFSYSFANHKIAKTGCPFCARLIRSITKHGLSSIIGGDKYICSKCGKEKNVSEFPPDKRKNRGHATRCRECKRTHDRERQRELMKDKEFRLKDKERGRAYRRTAKYRETMKRYYLSRELKTNIVFVECEDCDKIECVRASIHKKRVYKQKCKRCSYRQYGKDNYKGWTIDKQIKWKEGYKQKCIERGPDKCACCGKQYFRFEDGANHVTCSEACRKKRAKHLKKARKRFRGKRAKNNKESYNHLDVFKRDRWKCQNCGIKVQKKDIYADDAAEVDHVVTMAQGGKDEYWNVQTLCRKCNSNKGSESQGQLSIFHGAA